ncbi:MBL fold metallo-hydrolase [Candidatus Woesearchaeota archaeon]|nr:MBL fold metallo-hydrolase [Candidatus Woesearchaeota archaeon]
MIFEQVEVGDMQNFCYIIADEKSKEAAIVDAGWEPEKLLKTAKSKNLKIKYILLTHTHYDHINSLAKLFELTRAKILVHENDADSVENLGLPYGKLKDKNEINLGKLKIKVLHTPGHTPGSVCYLVENKLITGDTLFVEAVGRIDLPGGSKEELLDSLKKLSKLDGKIEICPGHDYGSRKNSTIDYEKKNNPFMRF